MSEAAATKAELRERFGAGLREIEPAKAAAAAERVATRLMALPEIAGARRILTCLSFGTELDTLRLVDRLQRDGRELFVPRADPRDRRLHVHPYPCPLIQLAFGLRQPPRGTPELPETEIDSNLDAALVLGLAFDAQLVAELPAEPHDVPMSAVVTESEVVRPGR